MGTVAFGSKKQWYFGPISLHGHIGGGVLETVVVGELLRQEVVRRSFADFLCFGSQLSNAWSSVHALRRCRSASGSGVITGRRTYAIE